MRHRQKRSSRPDPKNVRENRAFFSARFMPIDIRANPRFIIGYVPFDHLIVKRQ